MPVFDARVQVDPSVRDHWGIPVARLSGNRHPHDIEIGRFIAAKAERWLREAGAVRTWTNLPGPGPARRPAPGRHVPHGRRPEDLGHEQVRPGARHRQPVRRRLQPARHQRRLQPGADDHGPGLLGGQPHQRARWKGGSSDETRALVPPPPQPRALLRRVRHRVRGRRPGLFPFRRPAQVLRLVPRDDRGHLQLDRVLPPHGELPRVPRRLAHPRRPRAQVARRPHRPALHGRPEQARPPPSEARAAPRTSPAASATPRHSPTGR